MKIYNKKIVYDKNDNIIEEDSYEYHGKVAQAGGSVKKNIIVAAVVAAVVYFGPTDGINEWEYTIHKSQYVESTYFCWYFYYWWCYRTKTCT